MILRKLNYLTLLVVMIQMNLAGGSQNSGKPYIIILHSCLATV